MSKSLVQNSRIIAKKGLFQGREVLAFLAVVEDINGYSVRLVDVRFSPQTDFVALPKIVKKSPVISIKSPYFSSPEIFASDFSFVLSQPTRAPNEK